MLFAAVPAALLATHSLLVERLHATLLASAGIISVTQFVRGILLGNDVYSTCMATVLTYLLIPPVFLVLVAFGAPVLYLQLETLLLALVLAVLALQPLLTQYSMDSETWFQIFSAKLRNSVVYGSLGACIGAWIGAIPITLDWDRPWQAYPITIVLGAYLGSAVGAVVGQIFKNGDFPKRAAKTKTKTKSKTQ